MTGVLNMGGNEITGLPGLQFVNGSHLNEANGKLQAVNGNAGVRVSGADAVDDNDFVTKKQFDAQGIAVLTGWNYGRVNDEFFTTILENVEKKKPFFVVLLDSSSFPLIGHYVVQRTYQGDDIQGLGTRYMFTSFDIIEYYEGDVMKNKVVIHPDFNYPNVNP